MAINIRIGTTFDPKGLRLAQQQLNKVRGNFQNLGRNFAIAGAVFAGATAVIAKSAQALARIESINAQTAQTIKSMGDAANVSAEEVEALSNRLEALTATEAESIQEGANLLLTFGNISNQLGEGNDIFSQTTAIMVDMGQALKKGPVQTATMLGKALNDPIRGMAALRRVGVSFTEQQVEQVKALQESGDLMGAQKLILAELQNQYGGSGAAFAATFAGQLQLLNHELGALGEDATMVVMPALQTMVSSLRELAPEIGVKLSAAVAAVDWKAFTEGIVNGITFLVENAETIMKVVTALFLLNTAYNVGKIAIGLYSAVAAIGNAQIALTGVAAGKSAFAVGLLNVALRLIPWVAVATGAALASGEIAKSGDTFKEYTQVLADSSEGLSTFEINVGALILSAVDIMASWSPLNAMFRDLIYTLLNIPQSITIGVNVEVDKPKVDPKQEAQFRIREMNRYLASFGVDTGTKKALEKVGTGGSGSGKAAKDAGTRLGNTMGTFMTTSLSKSVNLDVLKARAKELFPILDSYKEFGNEIGNALIKNIQRAFPKIIGSLQKNLRKMYADVTKLQDAFIARTEFQTKLKEDVMSMFDFQNIKTGITGIIKKFREQVEQTKKFRDNLVELQKLGLSQDLFRKIAETQDFATAAELVKGGAGAITEINSLYGQLQGFSDEIALVGGNALYNLGVDAATGYIRTLEDGFTTLAQQQKIELKRNKLISEQVGIIRFLKETDDGRLSGLSGAALAEMKARLAELTVRIQAFRGSSQERQLDRLTDQVSMDRFFAGGGQMTDTLRQQFAAQTAFANLSRPEQREFTRETGYTINVSGGIHTASQIGQSVVDAIMAYERTSGAVYARA